MNKFHTEMVDSQINEMISLIHFLEAMGNWSAIIIIILKRIIQKRATVV